LTPSVNLHILAKRFTQLSKSAFFDPAFREFASKTVEVTNHVLDNPLRYPDDIVRSFEGHVWRVMQFVQGSKAKDAPHETQYALKKALFQWIKNRNVLISSASLEGFDFFLAPEDIWEFVAASINGFDTKGYKPLVVRIGSPEAFKHRPIFCIPLFHELGHFVDHHFKISELSLIMNPIAPTPSGVSDSDWRFINMRHRMEHFADLFGAIYCGEATNESLLAIAPNNPDSYTHPATVKRASVVHDFLAGKPNQVVNILQAACQARTGKSLATQFSTPDLQSSFDKVLTYRLVGDQELFGAFQIGWQYLKIQLDKRTAPWIDAHSTIPEIERTVNDLVEKSIRNYEIKERWQNGATN
jgi:hypothetical protein